MDRRGAVNVSGPNQRDAKLEAETLAVMSRDSVGPLDGIRCSRPVS
jgi:hypothetical protein